MRPTRSEVEAAANAIKFLVPIEGESKMRGGNWANWTDKGLAVTRWPRDFSADERKLIRAIARKVLTQRGL